MYNTLSSQARNAQLIKPRILGKYDFEKDTTKQDTGKATCFSVQYTESERISVCNEVKSDKPLLEAFGVLNPGRAKGAYNPHAVEGTDRFCEARREVLAEFKKMAHNAMERFSTS